MSRGRCRLETLVGTNSCSYPRPHPDSEIPAVNHKLLLVAASFLLGIFANAAEPAKRSDAVEKQLAKAKDNRKELEKALDGVPAEQRKGMEFLVANMPDSDLTTLKAEFLKSNCALAYKAKKDLPWGMAIPEAIFFNSVLPYANVDEKRDEWRKEFIDLCLPLVKDCKTPTEATMKLNAELFKIVKVKYSPQKRTPNLSPKEAIEQGNASCTGLSIVLSDACRAVGIPTRLVGTPNWSDKRGNHTWIEIWDGDWHFTGACEPDPNGLDRGWFVGDAAKAQKDVAEHAIYAVSFGKTGLHYPLVWAKGDKSVHGENVTERYAKKDVKKPDTVRVSIRIVDGTKKRVAASVGVSAVGDSKGKLEGKSRGETADLNDFLNFDLAPTTKYVVTVGGVEKAIETGKAGESQIVEVVVK